MGRLLWFYYTLGGRLITAAPKLKRIEPGSFRAIACSRRSVLFDYRVDVEGPSEDAVGIYLAGPMYG